RIEIGESVWVNFGAVVDARSLVQIGDRSMVGQYSIVADTEVPEAEGALADAAPIRIGRDVWIAGRVTVLPGARIGDGAVITAGSVVAGEIPAGVVAGGIPARVLRRSDGTTPVAELADAAAVVVAPSPTTPLERAEPVTAELTGVVIADFTAEILEQSLNRKSEAPIVAVTTAQYGQV